MTVTPKFTLKQATLEIKRINDAIRRGEKRAVMKSLAFIRTKVRTRVLRRRKKVSEPGKPPNIHSRGRISLRQVFFEYNEPRREGFVGPIKMTPQSPHKPATTVPNVLEFGGPVTFFEIQARSGDWADASRRTIRTIKRNNPKAKTRRRRKRIKARPYMSVGLSLVEQDDGILAPWANVVQ